MQKIIILILGIAACFSFTGLKKSRVIFFGDSITELGANKGGYIRRIDSLCRMEGKSDQFEWVGAGIGANKVYDLYLRLDEDVLSKSPDIVVIYIGVNDVWHKVLTGTGTDADKFEKFYTKIIQKLKEKNIKIILATPAVVGERTDFSNRLDGELNFYSNIVRNIAVTNGAALVDLREKFLSYNKVHNPENKEQGILTYDKVHLNDKGNQVVAEEMWKVIKSLH